MNQTYLTPERIRWLHCKSANVTLSPKYISIESKEVWGGNYFSRTGWCAHAPGNATDEWIGENFRKALLSSEYFNKPGQPSVNREGRIATQEASNRRRLTFWDDIARSYGYKDIDQAGRRCDLVFSSWHYLVDDFVILRASKRLTGTHRAWPEDRKYADKHMHVPLSAPDEELGYAVRVALSRCEAPGRQKINTPPELLPLPWGEEKA